MIVAVAEFAVVGPEEHRLVQVVHYDPEAYLGDLELVLHHFALVSLVHDNHYRHVHEDELCDGLNDDRTESFFKNIPLGIDLSSLLIK